MEAGGGEGKGGLECADAVEQYVATHDPVIQEVILSHSRQPNET